jgi:hypothetical protein
MSESDTFSGFSVVTGAGGRARVVFRLAHPPWQPGWDADGAPVMEAVSESVFDEADLVRQIRHLRREGLDASVSEAALAALREASAGPSPRGPQEAVLSALAPNLTA